ncbi:unnamed protein product [Effrenium voratum]|uniref:K Homology domain-containing protein n=1 Tax=Effrenium voratum TaxID=2562239 RepID=A0AA36JJF5_9DINO|nr:unnamed protein product [Effrenium voratum]CAJ1406156.1 unnamed protein product [Effrenium voratum]
MRPRTSPPAGVDMLTDALSVVPDQLADPADQSQVLQCSCPAHVVGSLIGKGGAALKEISDATGVHLDMRDMEGSFGEKAIIISGNAVGCVAAYLHIIGRIASLQESGGLEDALVGAEGFDAMAGAGSFL